MAYATMFDPVDWRLFGISFIQSFTIYWLVLFGLKIIGRRVLSEMGPEDLILLLLIADAASIGLVHQEGGFWSALAAVLALMTTVYLVERLKSLREWIDETPIVIMENGEIYQHVLDRFFIEASDLDKTAREFGMPDHQVFEKMILEADGEITGILKPEYRMGGIARKSDRELYTRE